MKDQWQVITFKLHLVADARGRPIQLFLSAGHRCGYVGAMALLSFLPISKLLVAD